MSQAMRPAMTMLPSAHRSTFPRPQSGMRLQQAALILWESTSSPEVNPLPSSIPFNLSPPSHPTDQLRKDATHTHPSAQRIQTARTTGHPVELAPAPDSRTVVDRGPYGPRTSAADTLTGATSQDVHNHLGHPGTGQTSSELHHDGQHGRQRAARGADQFGSGAIPRETEQPW